MALKQTSMEFTDVQLEKITAETAHIAAEAGRFLKKEILNLSKKDIETKGKHDYVTYVDRETERFLVGELTKLLPRAGFLAEEEHRVESETGFKWIIDPLDGTTNYIHKLPVYSISIALSQDEEIILGIVLEVNNDECFTTFKGAETYLNGRKVRVSSTSDPGESLLATGFPYADYDRLREYMTFLERMIRLGRGVRRYGSAAVDLAYVACGRFDAFFEYGLKPWDVAAGSLLVKNAGGHILDFSGEGNYIHGKEILATNPGLLAPLLAQLRECFGNQVLND